jgi:hypothetical protein
MTEQYKITYCPLYGSLTSQTRNTLQEAVAYALILEAREDLNVKVVSIDLIEND